MIKVDLITGFLGSGKTTFIRSYARHLLDDGTRIGIIVNDYGAVNVDMMLLSELLCDDCNVEMVIGGNTYEDHLRRFKTKLISLAMMGYQRVIVEPSGIFDADEFFDVLRDEPLDRWYEPGNVITLLDTGLDIPLSREADYLLVSQAANAGRIVMSRTQQYPSDRKDAVITYLRNCMREFHCSRDITGIVIDREWTEFTDRDWTDLFTCGYASADHVRMPVSRMSDFDSLIYMKPPVTEDELRSSIAPLINDPKAGGIIRIKGFHPLPDGTWLTVNITHDHAEITPAAIGQDVLLVIGENLDRDYINAHFHMQAL
ncbi:MAG: GTP-binding protein [Eubacterium sp.]|nr:GTP-binding protein [Eubacterium sp.]